MRRFQTSRSFVSPAGRRRRARPRTKPARTNETRRVTRKKKKDDERDATRAMTERLLAAARAMSRSTAGRKPRLRRRRRPRVQPRRRRLGRNGAGGSSPLGGLRLEAVRAHRDGAGGCARSLLPSECLATAIKWRLEMLEPVIESWPPRAGARRRRTPPRRRRASRPRGRARRCHGRTGRRAEPRDDGRDGVTWSPGPHPAGEGDKQTNGDDDADADADARGETAGRMSKKTPRRSKGP